MPKCIGGITWPNHAHLKPTCDTRIIHLLCARAALAWTKTTKITFTLKTRQTLKANRASETEGQRKERLRIRREKDRARRRTKKTTRGKEKVIRNRKQQEKVPGHSQKIEAS